VAGFAPGFEAVGAAAGDCAHCKPVTMCRFPDVVEELCHGHLGRQDTMSALITAEWCVIAAGPAARALDAEQRLMVPGSGRDRVSWQLLACPSVLCHSARKEARAVLAMCSWGCC